MALPLQARPLYHINLALIHRSMVTHRCMAWQQNNNLVKWQVCFPRPHGREQQGPPTQPSYSGNEQPI